MFVDRSVLLARPKQISASPVPGAGTVFALRAIGLVLAARWAFSMSQMGYLSSLRAMTSSPWACVNLVLIFLLIVLPGAKARMERPLHPLPQWLRQALALHCASGIRLCDVFRRRVHLEFRLAALYASARRDQRLARSSARRSMRSSCGSAGRARSGAPMSPRGVSRSAAMRSRSIPSRARRSSGPRAASSASTMRVSFR